MNKIPATSQDSTFPAHWGLPLIGSITAIIVLTCLVVTVDPWMEWDWPVTTLALNLWPPILLTALVVGLSGRFLVSLLISGSLVGLIFYFNERKLFELDQPLLFSDFLLIPQLIGNLGLFARYSHGAVLLGLVLILLLLALLAIRFEPRSVGTRTGLLIALIAAALIVSLASSPVTRIYAAQGALDRPWIPMESIYATGLIASLAAHSGDHIVPRPRRNPAALQALREWLPNDPEPTAAEPGLLPDIVLILSESFFDPGRLQGVDRCQVLPAWCELLDSATHGEISVPTFGGNTTRTEFEILTGVPYLALRSQVYPYISVVNRPTASIAWWLKSLGYETLAIHPHSGSFWHRDQAFPLLGFDEYISEENFGHHKRVGFFLSDEDMTDRIIRRLDDERESPQFIFAISMENHGPWGGHRPNMRDEVIASIPVPEELENPGERAFRQFIYHARNATVQLQRLYREILDRDRPALVLFFGDHLPGLHSTFRQLPFRDGQPPASQPTPFVLLTNREIAPEWVPRYSHQLGTWTLEQSGVPLSRFYRELLQTHQLVLNVHDEKIDPVVAKGVAALYAELLHLPPEEWEPHEVLYAQ